MSGQGQGWTCDESAEGGAALGTFASCDTACADQADILLAEACPQAPDGDFCVENLPGFWGMLSPIILTGHCSYICADIDECNPAIKVKSGCSIILTAVLIFKTFVPSCEACTTRINGVTDRQTGNLEKRQRKQFMTN